MTTASRSTAAPVQDRSLLDKGNALNRSALTNGIAVLDT